MSRESVPIEQQFFDPDTDRPYRLMTKPEARANKWILHVGGREPVFFSDEYQAKAAFHLVHTAFGLGRDSAFIELRRLIGAKRDD